MTLVHIRGLLMHLKCMQIMFSFVHTTKMCVMLEQFKENLMTEHCDQTQAHSFLTITVHQFYFRIIIYQY